MAGSRRRRQLKRQRERQQAAAAAAPAPAPVRLFNFHCFPPELLAEIHHRLAFLERLAFASVCGESGQLLRETPWLILPAENADRARVFSVADGESATVRTSDVAMRGPVAIGSSGGWLVTADDRGALRMTNPATGAHADLPAITTVPFIEPKPGGHWFCLDVHPFLQVRFGGQPPPPPAPGHSYDYPTARTFTVTAAQMRQVFYRKVVLSESPRPDSYAAMLIMERCIGAPAFATAEDGPDPSWRMARSPDAVEDAIHHDGRFLSITYTGRVEAWQRDAETGEFTSEEVAPRLAYEDMHLRRKYIAASMDGRLIAVLKHAGDFKSDDDHPYSRARGTRTRVSFKVQILDRVKGRWEEAADIGDTALFVGVNGSMCLSTREHQGIRPGCVYFTDDEVGAACLREANCQLRSYSYGEADDIELRDVGVYNLKAGSVETIRALGKHQLWPPPAWFTPSFL
ncbi:uncharacterized protein LOC8077367 [Sorghum bicolor]|jgi:hypothetical protein|uniref:uncharacterized protein LOC8077367 n=1 Tax=Sorghum bicolor TaxID=4558 RepID=UPI0001A8573E|nr:uncharacterized protein LOC8077367 [Sorghum bicolor]|eukprot:XP_002459110.1 uncharacterized protein LOC8077367 [Sorghum bicolor]